MLKKRWLVTVICLMLTSIFVSTGVFAGKIRKTFERRERPAKDINIPQENGKESKYAVLVSSEDFQYALWSVPLAKRLNAPIIQVNTKALDSDVKDELIKSDIKKVFIVDTFGLSLEGTSGQIEGTDIRYQKILKSGINSTSLKIAQFIVKNNNMVASAPDKFSNNIEFRSIYLTLGQGFAEEDSTFLKGAIESKYPYEVPDFQVLLLKNPLGSKESSISDLTTSRKEEGLVEVTGQTLLGDKKIVEGRAYDAEKVSEIIENKFQDDGRKIAFLTFDDGPSTTVTPKILDILKRNDIKATFFLIGSCVQADEESKKLVERIYEEGHSIGNHTYTHNLRILYPGNKVDIREYMEEVKRTNDAISNSIGREFKTRIIRMPGGDMSRKYYKDPNLNDFNSLLKGNNMYNIDWNAYDGDSEPRHKNADELFIEVKNTVGNQEKVVLLMHDTYGKEETAKALPNIIGYLKAKGYEFRTIE